MRCPRCGANNDRVLDTRASADNASIRRRRQCNLCGCRFTTHERIERRLPRVVKRDGSREPFDRAKIERGLNSACQKRPIKGPELDAFIDGIVAEIEQGGRDEIPSQSIGALIMERLRTFDPVAYIRFASVYSAFDDVSQFIAAVRHIGDPFPSDGKRDPGPPGT